MLLDSQQQEEQQRTPTNQQKKQQNNKKNQNPEHRFIFHSRKLQIDVLVHVPCQPQYFIPNRKLSFDKI